MTVLKHKDMDWKYYIQQLVENGHRISDIELYELCGYLLKYDLEDHKCKNNVLNNIFDRDNSTISELFGKFLTAESPESTEDLLRSMKQAIMGFYEKRIEALLATARKDLERECKDTMLTTSSLNSEEYNNYLNGLKV